MACVRKRRGKYVADYYDEMGVRRTPSFPTMEMAELALQHMPPRPAGEFKDGSRDPKTVHMADAAGVYFLYDFEKLVYVGSSWNVFSRLRSHMERGICFDRMSWVPVRIPSERLRMEQAYIDALNPPMNKTRRVSRPKASRLESAPA
jgi:hypothetical protein